MKIALYIEEGVEQIVLTPQSENETAILGKMTDGSREMSVKSGSFYFCQGGWIRHGSDDKSTIIVLQPPQPKDPMAYDEAAA
jgi:hypothetical protein